MSTKSFMLSIAVLLALVACESAPPEFQKSLTGEWEVTAFRVRINSAFNQDSAFLLDVAPGEWPEKMQQHPERIRFEMNNRFSSENISLDDELAFQRRGMWDLQNDTLLRLIEPKGTDDYRLFWLNPDAISLQSLLDHDGDGRSDDLYSATWHRLRPDSLTAADD